MLHNKFEVVPIDKTSGNVDFVCIIHSAQVLIKELRLDILNDITLTYPKPTKPIDNNQQKYKLSFNATYLKWAITYLLHNCYFSWVKVCFLQLIWDPYAVWYSPLYGKLIFSVILKRSGVFKQKNGTFKRLKYFQVFLSF